jgi:Ca2+-binding RTX toxin-like protein
LLFSNINKNRWRSIMAVRFGTTGDDTLTGSGSTDFIFGLSGNDALSGVGGDDGLYGGDGTDNLDGGAGNDVLDGGADADDLRGGAGDDIYLFASGDTIVESAGQGTDTVISSVFFDLAVDPDLENLRLDGASGIAASGNAKDNVIIGNAGNNVIGGDQGKDLLGGGEGKDTLSGNADQDTFVFQTVLDSPFGAANRDVITDFNSSFGTSEQIDLSAIKNANGANLTFVGLAATVNQGQVGFQTVAGNTIISVDVNGLADDMQIELTGLHNLLPTMFIL